MSKVKFKEPIQLSGVPGSPYTRKMLALLRFRRLRYQLIPGSRMKIEADTERYPTRPTPKVPLLPTFYGEDESGEEQAVCDSTPIIRQLESLNPERSVIPNQPELALLNSLVEDYADEWLTKAMFNYRWTYGPDIEKAGQMLPRWNNITASDEEMSKRAAKVSALQISRLRYVGSNSVTRDTIEQSFIRFLDLFDKHLNIYPFVLGNRPASCDFAIYGQLTCMALFDPTPQRLVLDRAPRVYAWTEVMEDLSGYELLENDWLEIPESCLLPASLLALLDEISSLYLPYLKANAAALEDGEDSFQLELDGREWEQQAFPYQAKCFKWLRNEYSELSAIGKERFNALVSTTNIFNYIS